MSRAYNPMQKYFKVVVSLIDFLTLEYTFRILKSLCMFIKKQKL